MRLKPRTWLLFSLLFFTAAGWMWQVADGVKARRLAQINQATTKPALSTPTAISAPAHTVLPAAVSPAVPANTSAKVPAKVASAVSNAPNYRLSNTPQTAAQLARNAHGVLLRNALIDTGRGTVLDIPAHLRSSGAPGSYIVQSDRPLNPEFYAHLQNDGAEFVSYIPNNAALVRAPAEAASVMVSDRTFQAVLPYEPYLKIDSRLLPSAVAQTPLTNNQLRVTAFPGQRDAAWQGLQSLGAQLVGEDQSPFGPTLIVTVPPDKLVAVAQLPETQEIELFSRRHLLNDLTRVRMGVSTDTVVSNNYLNLTGSNVWVALNDTGVDTNHPDFAPATIRLMGDSLRALTDTNGHGTHVAGTIIGNGAASGSVTNQVPGSVKGANFRGMAPGGSIYSQLFDLVTGPVISDAYLQSNASYYLTTAALTNGSIVTNGFVVNNSWGYNSFSYDNSAASWDAAVRNAQPGTPGEHSLTVVFAAGDQGNGSGIGFDNATDSINSPGTAKNAITVGAINSLRNITNTVDFPEFGVTNDPIFTSATDNNDLVANFSSAGNTDVGTEGVFGRFKPDLVAPGVFTVSARSTNFVDPTNLASLTFNSSPNQSIPPGQTNYYPIFIPVDTTNLVIQILPNALSPVPFPNNLQVWFDTNFPPRQSTQVFARNENNLPIVPYPYSSNWFIGIYNPPDAPHPVAYDLNTYILQTNSLGTYYTVLSNLNAALGPYYRYESGTSMSAATVSGLLALVQEFLWTTFTNNPSPALLKALVINGARPLGTGYDLATQPLGPNLEGWGLPNLASSIPGSLTNGSPGASMVFYEQSPTNALHTGQWHNYLVTINDPNALNFPLRCTLVWTDPPGNPAAGAALVNDLDLVVTDNVTGSNVFIGNDFAGGAIFTQVSQTNSPDPSDVINNVENVFIDPSLTPLSASYTVSVRGTRVNVNAASLQTNDIGQDYALVISSDDQTPAAALSVVDQGTTTYLPTPLVTVAFSGVPLLHQRVGANEPNDYTFPGSTNGDLAQWHFFVFTNTVTTTNANYTNVLFATFLPPTLTFPLSSPPNLSLPAANDADIDLYVSTNNPLYVSTPNFVLDPNAIAAASKSVGQGGTETVVFTNTKPDQVYYVGVKSESQQASDFGFFVIVTDSLNSQNQDGSMTANGLGLPVVIPDSLSTAPPADVFAFVTSPQKIRKAAVTAGVQHSNPSDLLGTVYFQQEQDVLNHYSGRPGGFTNRYDDQPEDPKAGDVPSDGPGTLKDFVGMSGTGLWRLRETDNALTQTGMVTQMSVQVWPQPPNELDFTITLPANGSYFGYVDVPNDATNMEIAVSYVTGTGPLGIYLTNRNSAMPEDYGTGMGTNLPIVPPGGSIDLGTNPPVPPLLGPPLSGGRWFYDITNESAGPVKAHVIITILRGLTPNLVVTVNSSDTPLPLATDAHTTSQICLDSGFFTNSQQIAALSVGVRIQNPNLDDLVLHLRGPQGNSILLFEDRGGTTATNLGLTTNGTYLYTTFTDDTNLAPQFVKFRPPPFAQPITNVTFDGSSFEVITGAYGETNGLIPVSLGTNVDGWTVTNTVLTNVVTNLFTIINTNFTTNGSIVTTNFATNTLTIVSTNVNTNINQVAVALGDGSDPAYDGTNYLALAAGEIVRTFPTVVGRSYILQEFYRGPGLLDWWPFEGDAHDLVNTNHNGTILGTLTNVFGEVGKGYQFNGNDSQITISSAAGEFGTNDFSIEYWINTSSTRASEAFIEKRNTCNANFPFWGLRIGGTPGLPGPGTINLELSNGGGVQPLSFTATVPVNDSQWHYVVWVRKGTDEIAYLDGQLNTTTNDGTLYNLSIGAPILIGQSICQGADGTLPYSGAINEFGLWGRALTGVEIAALYIASTNHVGKHNPTLLEPNCRIVVDGVTNSTLVAPFNGTNWLTNSVYFTAVSNNITVSITGNPLGMLFDEIGLVTPTNHNYVQPEQPLGTFTGENPDGCWTLDVWDTRKDAPAPVNGALLSWNLNVTISSTNVTIVTLTNHLAYTNALLSPGSIQYFAFDVPMGANFVTNRLKTVAPLLYPTAAFNLFFNQTGLPTGDQPGDFMLNGSPAGTFSYTLAKDTPPPTLQPGERYFLGVQCVGQAAPFAITVDTDVLTNFTAIPLSNGVIVTNIIVNSATPQFYSFVVPTNAISAAFEIINPTNEVDLYARHALPLPTTNTFDYSTSYAGTNNETIIVTTNSMWNTTNSVPVPLTPGTWYLAAYTYNTANPTTYRVVATYITNTITNSPFSIVPLTNLLAGVYTTNGVTGGISGAGPALTNFYSFSVTNNAQAVQFVVSNMNGNVDLIVRDGSLPTSQDLTAASYNVGNLPEVVIVITNELLPSLNGNWYIAVPNNTANIVHYWISAATTNAQFATPAVQPIFDVGAISPADEFTLVWSAVPFTHYEVQISTNLTTWSNLTTITPINNFGSFTDTNRIEAQPRRFYRLIQTQ